MAFDILKTHKNPGKIWFGLSVPAGGARLTIGADGTPDATENPNAVLVGLTEAGSTFGLERTFTDEYFDEFKESLETTLDQVNAMIKCRAAQVMDFDLLEEITVGATTRADAAGIHKLNIGQAAALAYSGVAIISPTKENAAKFAVFHLYKAFNVSNIELAVSRQTRAGLDLEFRGVGIPTRAATDTLGSVWKQTS